MSRAGRSDGDLTKSKILDAAGRLIVMWIYDFRPRL